MSEFWTRLLTGRDEKLTEIVKLAGVKIARAAGSIQVDFTASQLLKGREVRALEEALQGGFPDINVSISVSYPELKEKVLEDVNAYKDVIISRLIRQSPGSMPFIGWKDAEWCIKDGTLIVPVNSKEGAEFLKMRRADEMIAQIYRDAFGLEMRVKIEEEGDYEERLKRIAERHRLEDIELAKAAAEIKPASSEQPVVESKAIIGLEISDPSMPMSEIREDSGKVCVTGEIINFELRDTKKEDCKILSMSVTDYTNSLPCKAFIRHKRGRNQLSFEQMMENISKYIKEGKWIKLQGVYQHDEYDHRYQIMIDNMMPASKPSREDTAPVKRVELHLHTQMSSMDACAAPADLVAQAAKWGHKAIAITDHGVVQAFPEAFSAGKKNKIKIIPGCEGYLIDDAPEIVKGADYRPMSSCRYVVLDVETTGLNTKLDKITEIGAVRIENGVETAEYSKLIDPERPIPEKVTELTGIDNGMVRGQPTIEQVTQEFYDFCKGCVIVAHNAAFDTAFFRRAFEKAGLPFDFPVMDTLALCRNYYKDMKTHKLGQVCKALGIDLKNAHRAVHDARATSLVMVKTLESMQKDKPFEHLADMNTWFATDTGGEARHIILLATSRDGMTNLNHMISESNLRYFHRMPRMPRAVIQRYRKDVIVGSACEAGELYRAIVNGKSESEIEKIAAFYDYLEIQPIGNNAFLLRKGKQGEDENASQEGATGIRVDTEEDLKDLNRKIVSLGDRLGIPVAATGDVHFLEPYQAEYRKLIMLKKGFEDCDMQPPLYFRTTDDMLREFAYLGKEDANYVVVEAPNEIADRVEHIEDLFMKTPDGGETFQPFWEDAEETLRRLCKERSEEIFGTPVPEIVQKRLDKELGSICGYGFSTLYMIAVKLVRKSLSDGYIVGSRGSVGSSFVAKMAGITEVDALPPYYVCPKCKHYEFDVPKEYTCGLDLPAKNCPECGTVMTKDGFNIPFEVFLGFKGDKVPDIDLNFSGVYQPRAHQYVKDLFGEENVFRAGTISGVADKTAYGYVLKYAEKRGLNISQAEKERLAKGITGVKRTTGQHPAGMVVLPKGYEIEQFTALQHPAEDVNSPTITTHFDFTSMHDVLVKLDILGHDDPTMLRNLQDITGIKPQAVPLDDRQVFDKILSLFSGPEALGITAEELGVTTGTLGIPEFGTPFVRGMLNETKPTTMEELIRISGLSHGTAVWLGNIQDILKRGDTDLKHAICTRDDIMNQLMEYGVEPKMAFTTMEFVRKGKAAAGKGGDLKPEMLEAMVAANTPSWFIEACRKIEYMFPKAHAVAYVTMALRIAYFKIYYPVAYYACYLWRNAESFDGDSMACGLERLREMQKEIEGMEKDEREKADGKYTIIQSLIEMNLRGIRMLPVDMYRSDAERFIVADDTHILPPLSSLPGLGLSAALEFMKSREGGPFISREDMLRRKVGKSVIDKLAHAGCLGDLPETSQVSLFEI